MARTKRGLSEAERAERRARDRERLQHAARELLTSDGWQRWMRARALSHNASPHSIASYRDTIRLLLTYASQRLGVEPSRLDLGQLDAPLIGAFLDHLETDRGCSPRTRNTRLAAIRTFYRYCWCAIQNTPPRSSGSCRSGPSATNARWSPISPNPSSTRSSTPQTAQVDDHAARPAPHRRDAPPARRRRHHGDRAVARTRASRNHADVLARRPRAQRTSTRAHKAAGQHTRPLPPARRAPAIPGRTVNMSSSPLLWFQQQPRR
jgi:hypothetical protein